LPLQTSSLQAAALLIWKSGLLDVLEAYVVEQLSYDLRHVVRPAVISNILSVTAARGARSCQAMLSIVNHMYESLRQHLESVSRLEGIRRAFPIGAALQSPALPSSSPPTTMLRQAFQQLCRSLLCYRMPDDFYATVDAFYAESLKVYHDKFKRELGEFRRIAARHDSRSAESVAFRSCDLCHLKASFAARSFFSFSTRLC